MTIDLNIENQFGSRPLQAVELANSLKMQKYDYGAITCDPAERDKPLYRIRIVNRDAW